jgi:hypothetical protein
VGGNAANDGHRAYVDGVSTTLSAAAGVSESCLSRSGCGSGGSGGSAVALRTRRSGERPHSAFSLIPSTPANLKLEFVAKQQGLGRGQSGVFDVWRKQHAADAAAAAAASASASAPVSAVPPATALHEGEGAKATAEAMRRAARRTEKVSASAEDGCLADLDEMVVDLDDDDSDGALDGEEQALAKHGRSTYLSTHLPVTAEHGQASPMCPSRRHRPAAAAGAAGAAGAQLDGLSPCQGSAGEVTPTFLGGAKAAPIRPSSAFVATRSACAAHGITLPVSSHGSAASAAATAAVMPELPTSAIHTSALSDSTATSRPQSARGCGVSGTSTAKGGWSGGPPTSSVARTFSGVGADRVSIELPGLQDAASLRPNLAIQGKMKSLASAVPPSPRRPASARAAGPNRKPLVAASTPASPRAVKFAATDGRGNSPRPPKCSAPAACSSPRSPLSNSGLVGGVRLRHCLHF